MQGKMSFQRAQKRPKDLNQRSKSLFLLFLFTSLGIHFLTYVNIQYFFSSEDEQKTPVTEKVKIKYVDKVAEDESQKKKQIVETPMSKTEKPNAPDYLGAQDHIAKEQTKVANPDTMAYKAGPKGNAESTTKPQIADNNTKVSESKTDKGKRKAKPKDDTIQHLLPTPAEMFGQMDAGYQDYIEERLKEGDVVDLNTANFRFLGYVTHLRQAIQLVWTYPQEAAMRGLEGKVLLQFRIQKDGTTEEVKVVQSSGYSVLDHAIVSAIKLASPFAPLPENIDGDSKVFAGTFHYTLNGMYRAH